MILPNDGITRLAGLAKPFVTGIYFQRNEPHRPLIATFNGDSFHWVMQWPADVIAPIDGCGFGCVLTSVGMLRKLESPWFKFERFSEDFDFCIKAQKAGYQLYVHTAVLCGHLKDPQPATYEDFQREHPQFYGGDNGIHRLNGQTGNLAVSGTGAETGQANLPQDEVQLGAVR